MMIKNLVIITAIFALLSCDNNNDEIYEIVNRYKTKPKSQNLIGFWQLEGVYPPNTSHNNQDIGIGFNGYVGIGYNEILFLDQDYLRFLNKASNDNDSLYSYNSKNKFHWFNEGNFINSLQQFEFNSKDFQNIQEYQIPYKFGQLKDTLIVQSNGKILYLTKKGDIKFVEYDFK